MSDLADVIENYMLKGKQYDQENADTLYGGWKLIANSWSIKMRPIWKIFIAH